MGMVSLSLIYAELGVVAVWRCASARTYFFRDKG